MGVRFGFAAIWLLASALAAVQAQDAPSNPSRAESGLPILSLRELGDVAARGGDEPGSSVLSLRDLGGLPGVVSDPTPVVATAEGEARLVAAPTTGVELVVPPLAAPVVASAAPVGAPARNVTLPPPDLPEAPALLALPGPSLDALVMEAMRTALAERGGVTHPRLDRRLRQALVGVYEGRELRPLWLVGENWTAAARAAMARLLRADEDGLDAAAYALPAPVAAGGVSERAKVLAGAEMRLSIAVLLYARDARGGRIEARRLSDMIDPTIRLPEPGEVLATVAGAADAGAALASFHPPHEGYVRLRAKLAELRSNREVVAVAIPDGADLKVGMNDPRVPLMRERFGLPGALDPVYDAELARVVASFQRERGLPATGAFNRRTASALRDLSGDRMIADVIANMERWRWLPETLGERHVFVNVPEFLVRVMDRGRKIHEARVIVGKPETPTPIFSHEMAFMVVNPSWFVPPSILKKEFLPKMTADPSYAERRGYVVVRNGKSISIRQPPGERNALGNIKFMFPNRHSVYLHDTPSRGLFGTERRAYSHGCVRVDNPFRLAELLFADPEWTESRVRSLVGRGERSLKLQRKVPVHLVYFTHSVDDAGRLVIRDDLYGYHRKVRAALGFGA